MIISLNWLKVLIYLNIQKYSFYFLAPKERRVGTFLAADRSTNLHVVSGPCDKNIFRITKVSVTTYTWSKESIKKNDATTESKATVTQVHLVERLSKKLYLLACKIHQWIGEYSRNFSNRELLLWYLRKVIYQWDNRRYSCILFWHWIFLPWIKPPRTAKINMTNSWTSFLLRVRKNETTPRSAAEFWQQCFPKFTFFLQKVFILIFTNWIIALHFI